MDFIQRGQFIFAVPCIAAVAIAGCMHDSSDEPHSNTAPVANAGTDARVTQGIATALDGTASSDVDGDALTYAWSLTTRPAGSAATLSDAAAAQPSFTPDVGGVYVASLTVNDGTVSSASDTVTIAAGVRVPEYVPLDANMSCTWTYQWTVGASASTTFTATTAGTSTVPYTSGALQGVWFENQGEQNRILIHNDGTRVRYLGYADLGQPNAYLGTNCALAAPPGDFDFDIAYSGLTNDRTPHYAVTQESVSACEGPDTSPIVYTVQDMTVNGTTYEDALIMWWLDTNYAYKSITGLDSSIVAPSSAQTGGAAITDISIFAKNIGPVLQIGVSAADGTIPEAYRFVSMSCM